MNVNYNNKSFLGTSLKISISVILIAGVVLFLFFLAKSTTKETEVVISSTSFEVKGMFGGVYDFDKVTAIEMEDSIPAVIVKTNGSGLGEVKKGSFKLEGLGECKLFTLSDNGPFIYVLADGKYVIMNYADKVKTEKLYNALSSAWKK